MFRLKTFVLHSFGRLSIILYQNRMCTRLQAKLEMPLGTRREFRLLFRLIEQPTTAIIRLEKNGL